METNIIKIGNSQGVIIPKKMLDHWGSFNKVQIEIDNDRLVIVPIQDNSPRKEWEKQFSKAMKVKKGADLADLLNIENEFDKNDWTW